MGFLIRTTPPAAGRETASHRGAPLGSRWVAPQRSPGAIFSSVSWHPGLPTNLPHLAPSSLSNPAQSAQSADKKTGPSLALPPPTREARTKNQSHLWTQNPEVTPAKQSPKEKQHPFSLFSASSASLRFKVRKSPQRPGWRPYRVRERRMINYVSPGGVPGRDVYAF